MKKLLLLIIILILIVGCGQQQIQLVPKEPVPSSESLPVTPKQEVKYECHEDLNCASNQACRHNRCIEIECTGCNTIYDHKCMAVNCCSDSICNDSNPNTLDKCISPRTMNSHCVNTLIEKTSQESSVDNVPEPTPPAPVEPDVEDVPSQNLDMSFRSDRTCESLINCIGAEYQLCFEGYCIKANAALREYIYATYEHGYGDDYENCRTMTCEGCASGVYVPAGIGHGENRTEYCLECSSNNIFRCKEGYTCVNGKCTQ